MVQMFTTGGEQSFSNILGQSLGQAAGAYGTATLNQRMQQQQEEKAYQTDLARRLKMGTEIAKSLKRPELASLFAADPKTALDYLKYEATQNRAKFSKEIEDEYNKKDESKSTQGNGNVTFNNGQEPFGSRLNDRLRPGQAPILPQEEIPADEEMPAEGEMGGYSNNRANVPGNIDSYKGLNGQQESYVSKNPTPIEQDLNESPNEFYKRRDAEIDRTYKKMLAKKPTSDQLKDLNAWKKQEKTTLRAEVGIRQTNERNKIAKSAQELGEYKTLREGEQKNVQDYIAQSDQQYGELGYQKGLMKLADQSLNEGNFGLLSPDNIAQLTGVEGFRTPRGEAYRTAIKEYFLNDIKNIAGRPNMFVEQMLAGILPSVGKTREANKAWHIAQKMKQDMIERKHDLIDERRPFNLDEKGYVKGSLINDVNNRMHKIAEDIANQSAYRLKKLTEENASDEDLLSLKKVVKDTPVTAKRLRVMINKYGVDEAVKKLKASGYTIYPNMREVDEEE